MKSKHLSLFVFCLGITFPFLAQHFEEVKKVGTSDSLIIGKMDNVYIIVNTKTGKESAPYSKVELLGENFLVTNNQKSGIVDFNIQEILPCSMKSITLLKSGNHSYYRIQNGNYGLLDMRGNLILDTVYDYVEDRGALITYKTPDQKFGLLNAEGKQIPGMKGLKYWSYTNIPSWAICEMTDKSEVLLHIPSEKIVKLPPGCLYFGGVKIDGLKDHFVIRNKKKEYSLIDSEGKMQHPFGKYIDDSPSGSPVTYFRGKNQSVIFFNDNGKLGQRNCKDIYLVEQGFDGEQPRPFLYAYKHNSEYYQLVNQDLKAIIPQQFKLLELSEHGIVAQNTEGKFGLISSTGENVIPYLYDGFMPDVWQYTAMKKSKEIHLFNHEHQRVFSDLTIEGIQTQMGDYEESYIQLKIGKTYSLVSIENNSVVLTDLFWVEQDEETYFMDNIWDKNYDRNLYHGEAKLITVKMASGTGLYSLTNRKFIIEPDHEQIEIIQYYNTEDYVALVKKGGKYNLYDFPQRKLIFANYVDEITVPKGEGVIKAVNGNQFYILAGDFSFPKLQIIPLDMQYKKATFIQEYDIMINEESAYTVYLKGKRGILRKDGIWIHKPELEYFEGFHMFNYIIVKKNGLFYIVTIDGNYVTDKGFESVDFYGDGGDLARGFSEGKEYRISESGKVVPIE